MQSLAPPDGMPQSLAVDATALGELHRSAERGSPEALGQVAQQFEALFLGMVLDSMRSASPGDGLGESSGTELYRQLLDRQIAQDIAAGRGLGFARMVVEQLGGGTDSAAPAPETPRPAPQVLAPGQFLRELLPQARRAADQIGVDPLALVAQAALESGWGGHLPRRADGSNSFNLFGIKADSSWQGPRAVAQTLEVEDGVAVRRTQVFRAYPDYASAFDDYARLVGTAPRYGAARANAGDATRYLAELQAAGYATDPAYAQKVGRVLAQLSAEGTGA